MSWKEDILRMISEEENDHDRYEELSEEAYQDGYHHESGVLADIAHEEKTHRDILREILK